MDFVQILLLTGVAVGAFLVVLSFFGKNKATGPEITVKEEVLEKRLEAMGTTISEADSVITELGGMSQNVLKEMEQKYGELLFLYNLIVSVHV